jgi:hypothetical protein|tara:strand:- start:7922 stop:8110 length:189 start_codon:yes stop_codon:yes gene_type:complete
MENLKDELYEVSNSVHSNLKSKKRLTHSISIEDLETHLDELVALERVASLLTTAGYILGRLK